MNRYTCNFGGSVGIVDGTRYVTSGEFYFDCKTALLVRRTPIQFPVEEAQRATNIRINDFSDQRFNEFLNGYLLKPDWYKGFTYDHTAVLEDKEPIVVGEVFTKIISYNQESIVVDAFYWTSGHQDISVNAETYDPQLHLTYEQIKERAKNSCPLPQ